MPGVNSRARPGETITIYGIGFGAVNPAAGNGQVVTQTNQLSAPLQIKFAGTVANTTYSGLATQYLGLYQFNVIVPQVSQHHGDGGEERGCAG